MAKRLAPPPADKERNPFDELIDNHLMAASPTASAQPEEPVPASEPPAPDPLPEPPEPTVNIVEPQPQFAIPAAFSDDPPEGWGTGAGNVLAEDPVTSSLDPVAMARASLQEDAARARGEIQPRPAAPPVPVVQKVGNRAPDIRQALARAAARPTNVSYRSRISIGTAWQYDGKLHVAPDWVDRNWVAYDNGPAINIPGVGYVHLNEWIVVQHIADDKGAIVHTELKVYDDTLFHSLFRPEPPALAEAGTEGGSSDAEQNAQAG